MKSKLTTQPNTATIFFFFRSEKKKLFVAERCHIHDRGLASKPRMLCGIYVQYRDALREDLKLRDDMERSVRQGYKLEEALDFLKRDFPMYAWSYRSLDRRLRCFEIYYNNRINPEVSVEEDKDAVKKELESLGRLLGYRVMHKKARQEYNLHVTRDALYNVMYDLDPEGLEARGGIGVKKKRKKGNFSSKGPNFVHSLDGHDKMMGVPKQHISIGCLRLH